MCQEMMLSCRCFCPYLVLEHFCIVDKAQITWASLWVIYARGKLLFSLEDLSFTQALVNSDDISCCCAGQAWSPLNLSLMTQK